MVQREPREIMLKLVATFRFFFLKILYRRKHNFELPKCDANMYAYRRTCARVEGGGKVKLLKKK